MKMEKGMTAVPGLIFFALVIAVTIAVVYLLGMLPLIDKLLQIKSGMVLEVQQDDSGSAMAALLQSQDGGRTMAEIIGDKAASGYPAAEDAVVSKTLNNMKPAGRLAVYYRGAFSGGYNTDGFSSNYMSADIALPGGRVGEARVQ
jgi:hypothetical protein